MLWSLVIFNMLLIVETPLPSSEMILALQPSRISSAVGNCLVPSLFFSLTNSMPFNLPLCWHLVSTRNIDRAFGLLVVLPKVRACKLKRPFLECCCCCPEKQNCTQFYHIAISCTWKPFVTCQRIISVLSIYWGCNGLSAPRNIWATSFFSHPKLRRLIWNISYSELPKSSIYGLYAFIYFLKKIHPTHPY